MIMASFHQVAERGLIPGLKLSPALVSYIACAAAGSSNILFSRQSELREGAPVCDENGKVSKQSAIYHISKTHLQIPLSSSVSSSSIYPIFHHTIYIGLRQQPNSR